jgi:hypothetical protein
MRNSFLAGLLIAAGVGLMGLAIGEDGHGYEEHDRDDEHGYRYSGRDGDHRDDESRYREHEDDERQEYGEGKGWRGWLPWLGKGGVLAADFRPVDDPLYREECGSCHMAFQPGLLPARSWQRIMDGLQDHFGDDASLDADTQARLTAYLEKHAADRDGIGRAAGVARSIPGNDAPLRFTTTAYFRHKHHELPPSMVRDNAEIGSFSRCEVCHPGAEQGSYNEHEVRIPGVGRWDD